MNRHTSSVLSVACFLLALNAPVYADSATWSTNPGSGIWTEITNWTPTTVPNGPGDTASFGTSNITNISVPVVAPDNMHADVIQLDSVVFNPGASAYTISLQVGAINPSFNVTGAGIINNSGIEQNFSIPGDASMSAGRITFNNSASAGALTTFRNARGDISFFGNSSAGSATFNNVGATNFIDAVAVIQFSDNSTADHATFTNGAGGPTGGAPGNFVFFSDSASAGSAMFTNQGSSIQTTSGARLIFNGSSSASNGIFVNNGGADAGPFGGGGTEFYESSTAQNATLIANGSSTGGNGGAIRFADFSTGGTARVEVFGNGYLDISPHTAPGVSIGSLEGTGNVFLGANKLTVGSNNLSTIFSGVMQDGGQNAGTGGSLTKIGNGTLTLSGANTYTGSTTVNAGVLFVNGSITSAITVNGGTIGGSGTTGGITVNSGGTLAPGNSPGILNVAGNLTLTMGATYLVDLNGMAVGTQYDQTNVTGMVALGNATLSLSLGFGPANSATFNIINNDLSDLVIGMFNGLPEGATFTANGQTFMISYQGGDGNDVVLMSVIPEPGTWDLLACGGAFLAKILSRRRRTF